MCTLSWIVAACAVKALARDAAQVWMRQNQDIAESWFALP